MTKKNACDIIIHLFLRRVDGIRCEHFLETNLPRSVPWILFPRFKSHFLTRYHTSSKECTSSKVVKLDNFLILGLITCLYFTIPSYVHAGQGNVYEPMPPEKAQQLFRDISAQGKLPQLIGKHWEVPGKLDVKGVSIDKNDWLIFGKVERSFLIVIPAGKGLPKGFPKSYDKSGKEEIPFIPSYIFCASVDTIMDKQLYKRTDADAWAPTAAILKKGCYIWYNSHVSILTEDSNHSNSLILFNKLIKSWKTGDKSASLNDVIDLSFSGVKKGILIRFGEKEFALR